MLDETGEEEPWKSLLRQAKGEEDRAEGSAAITPFGTLMQHDVPVDIIVFQTDFQSLQVCFGTCCHHKNCHRFGCAGTKEENQGRTCHTLASGPDEVLPLIAERGG